jgi:hypothetical protein
MRLAFPYYCHDFSNPPDLKFEFYFDTYRSIVKDLKDYDIRADVHNLKGKISVLLGSSDFIERTDINELCARSDELIEVPKTAHFTISESATALQAVARAIGAS